MLTPSGATAAALLTAIDRSLLACEARNSVVARAASPPAPCHSPPTPCALRPLAAAQVASAAERAAAVGTKQRRVLVAAAAAVAPLALLALGSLAQARARDAPPARRCHQSH